MIKKFSVLTLCAFAISVQTQAMHMGEYKLSLFGITAHRLFRSTCKQDMQWWQTWWQLKSFREELVSNPLALYVACRAGDLVKVDGLLAASASLNVQDKNGWTPLHWASFRGLEQTAKFLINHGARVDSKDNSGWTALHYALGFEDKKIAKLLIKHGAPLNVQDIIGRTPLHLASSQEHEEIAKSLVCASFFPPYSLRTVRTAQPRLQERCLMALDKVDEDAINKYIIPYMAQYLPLNPEHNNDNFPLLIADYAPLTVQQALVTYWQKQASREDTRLEALTKLNLFLRAHCERHLRNIQAVLEIKNNDQKTARDVALSFGRNHQKIVALFDHFKQARTFAELDPALKKAITESIKDKLF